MKKAIENGKVVPQNALSIFDNDRSTVSDTPPDLGNGFFYRNSDKDLCDVNSKIRIHVHLNEGSVYYDLKPDKMNLMSNFLSCSEKNGIPHLSIEQIKRARHTLENGSRKYLIQ